MALSGIDDQDTRRATPAVQWLIALSVAVYVLQLTLVRAVDLQGALGFERRDLTTQPWTILTYLVVHAGFLHLVTNLYALWIFGPRLERAWGTRSFVWYVLWCGLGGWLFQTIFIPNGLLLGSTSAVLGVMLAYAMRWPDEDMLFLFVPVKTRWLVALVGGAILATGLAVGGTGGAPNAGYFAHLGGLAFGWLWLYTSSVSIERLRQRVSQVPDVAEDEPPRAIPPRSSPRLRERDRDREATSEIDEIVARSNAIAAKPQRPFTGTGTLPPRAEKAHATELDEVLDKISEHGLDSLTGDERRLLEECSRRLRDS